MDNLLVAFTLTKAIVILYGARNGIQFLVKGFGQKDDGLKLKGFKYAATIGIVILLTALEFLMVSLING